MTSGGKRAGAGRPAKNYKTITINIPVEVAEKIKQLSKELKCSQGEVIAYIFSWLNEKEYFK